MVTPKVDDGTKNAKPAPLARVLSELRVFVELGSLVPSLPALMSAPRGDGHAVLVLPGMFASDRSTTILRRYLRGLGYQAHGWKLGRNWGPSHEIREGTAKRLTELSDQYGRRISLIGWSLGGIYARELARTNASKVRQIITLASPFAGGLRREGIDAELAERLKQPPPVPSTAIYTKTDGVVPWAACREIETPTTDNIEIPATHIGLGVNPLALWAIADRLALPEGGWRPFDRQGIKSLLYPRGETQTAL